jgi:hypothetical protein
MEEKTEPLTIEQQIEQIVGFKNFIDEDPTNDYFLFPFMSMVLNLTDSQGFLTQAGIKILFNEINKDFDIINEGGENPSQYAMLRLAVYFTTAFNLIIYFGGFVLGLDTEEGKKYAEKLPVELIDYLKTIMERVDKLHPIIECQVKSLTTRLSNKFAKIYNEEKRKCWTKEIFQDSVHIPAHKDDVPEGWDASKSININTP